MRSACFVKSNPNRPLTHRKSPLIPLRSRLFERRISWLRTLSVVLQPFEQCVHTVGTYAISHGRVLYRYVPLVGALTSGTYRYKTRPWEMAYVSTVCTHCSNGCKTTLSVRNHEILRSNNRDLSGINGDFLCVKGRFGFDFTKHVERIRQPLVRKGDRLYPVSWEEAALAAATKLKAAYDSGGKDAIGFIGSNRTSNEENYLLQKLARTTFGTNNIDHHRTADYTGLITALGERAGYSLLTMERSEEHTSE